MINLKNKVLLIPYTYPVSVDFLSGLKGGGIIHH